MNKKRKKQIRFATLKDVADLADVSPVTVSRVYNPKWEGKVKVETVRRVKEAAKELGYFPNGIARSLNLNKTNSVAIVLGERKSYIFEEALKIITAKVQASGRKVLFYVVDQKLGIEHTINQVSEQRVDAIILTASATNSEIFNYHSSIQIPIILLDRAIGESNISSVYCDANKASQDLVSYLIQNGHTNIVSIFSEDKVERKNGFLKKMKEHNLNPVESKTIENSYDIAYDFAKSILAKKDLPDAVFCTSDIIAMAVIDCARIEFGLEVPKDFSITGFDNLPFSGFKAYDLTSMEHPLEEMTDSLMEVLEQIIKNPKIQIAKKLKMHLVKRSSVKNK